MARWRVGGLFAEHYAARADSAAATGRSRCHGDPGHARLGSRPSAMAAHPRLCHFVATTGHVMPRCVDLVFTRNGRPPSGGRPCRVVQSAAGRRPECCRLARRSSPRLDPSGHIASWRQCSAPLVSHVHRRRGRAVAQMAEPETRRFFHSGRVMGFLVWVGVCTPCCGMPRQTAQPTPRPLAEHLASPRGHARNVRSSGRLPVHPGALLCQLAVRVRAQKGARPKLRSRAVPLVLQCVKLLRNACVASRRTGRTPRGRASGCMADDSLRQCVETPLLPLGAGAAAVARGDQRGGRAQRNSALQMNRDGCATECSGLAGLWQLSCHACIGECDRRGLSLSTSEQVKVRTAGVVGARSYAAADLRR